MAQTGIAEFPFKNDFANDCLKRTTTIEDTLCSAIRSYIVTRRGSRLGNMVGSFVLDILNDLISIKDLPGLARQLKTDLTAQFPGVNFINVVMTLDTTDVTITLLITITFSVPNQDNIVDLVVKLPSIFDSSTMTDSNF